jgi:hypothetical protein
MSTDGQKHHRGHECVSAHAPNFRMDIGFPILEQLSIKVLLV